jgi:23S rRNA (guanosine2251-2'-O)-methyltransferase
MKTVIYGKNPVTEAVKAGRKVDKVYVSDGLRDQSFLDFLKQNGVSFVTMNSKAMVQNFNADTQGIVAEVEEYKYVELDSVLRGIKDRIPFLVMLDGLEDPHNLGAIIRSAEATGVDGIILAKNRSVGLSATVVKVSTGAIEYVNLIEVTNLVTTLKSLKDKGFWVIGADMDGNIDFRNQDYKMPVVLVIGSEGKGISRLVKENCDFLVNIPMFGKVNSLNASVSAGILFYEVIRNREKR